MNIEHRAGWKQHTRRAALGVILASICLPAQAQNLRWTAIGSTGTAQITVSNGFDETVYSPPRIFYSGPKAMLNIGNAGTLPIRANVRYNVVATDGVFNRPTWPTPGHTLTARFRSPRQGTRVNIRLIGVSLTTGTAVTWITIASNSWPGVTAAQTRSATRCGFTMDFNQNAYYVDVEMEVSDRATDDLPYIESLQMEPACYTPPPPEAQ